jgi:CheY-like chemotaxis protein
MTDTNAKTILVVEDERLLRDMVRSILESCAYRVLEAESGGTALELWSAEGEKIDLLLTDIMLSRGMSGMELAKRLLKDKPGLKIIFSTGRILPDQEREAFENARFLQKPYQHSDLIKLVNQVLKAP